MQPGCHELNASAISRHSSTLRQTVGYIELAVLEQDIQPIQYVVLRSVEIQLSLIAGQAVYAKIQIYI